MVDNTKFKLNDNGLIPTIAFGTGTSYFNRPDDVGEGLVKAVKAGFKLIDSAVMYGTEVGVGKGLRKVVEDGSCKREDLFITTKLAPSLLTFKEVVTMVDDSLRNLQIEYLDLMMIHYPGNSSFSPKANDDPNDPKANADGIMEMWEALQACQEENKIKHIGVSNFTRRHIERLIKNPKCKVVPAVNQIEFNPYMVDKDIFDVCRENNILVQSYAPIGSGSRKPVNLTQVDENWNLLEDSILRGIAAKYNCTVGQVCIGYAIAKGVAVVTKTEKEERMFENLGSIEIAGRLSKEDIEKIDSLNKNMRKFWNPYLVA